MPMSTAGRSTNLRKDGFTLFELIVVIAILAIAAGLVVPNINLGIGGDGVKGALRCVQTVLDQGRTHARLTRTDVTIVFKPSSVSIMPGKSKLSYPDSVRFDGILIAGDDSRGVNELIVDRRGVVPASIVKMRVGDQVYSFFISPVLRDVEYRTGIAEFSDFTD